MRYPSDCLSIGLSGRGYEGWRNWICRPRRGPRSQGSRKNSRNRSEKVPPIFRKTFHFRPHGPGLSDHLSTAGSTRTCFHQHPRRSTQLDETSSHQYYIAAKSSPADDRAGVLKYGKMFCVFDRFGDIQTSGLGEEGLFFEGTRHLSQLSVSLWNSRPLLLSSTIETNNFLFAADLANLDVSHKNEVVIPRGTLHVHRSKFLWKDVYYEEFKFTNYGMGPLSIPFWLTFDADFADIFEVRGMHREHRGRRLETDVRKDAVPLDYEGLDGVVRKCHLCCEPVP